MEGQKGSGHLVRHNVEDVGLLGRHGGVVVVVVVVTITKKDSSLDRLDET